MSRMGTRSALISLCFGLLTIVARAVNPIVVEPSQYWEGDDGPWSTFSLRLGTPEQVVRVHVSTAWPNSVAVLNNSCSTGSDSACATVRGEVFAPNSSSTWQSKGIFSLYPELNYSTTQDTAYFGLDSIGLGLESSGVKLENQVLAAMETDDYSIGFFGLDPQTTNWTSNFTEQSPSFFKTLHTQGLIPSLTYSYTAGAQYRFKQVVGSLVFGGYDSSRVAVNDLTFQFADDVSRDLVVAIRSIGSESTDGSSHDLLPGGSVLAFIDSTIPYFVLPYDACVEFETALGLEWNPKAGSGGLYTLTDTQHSNLLALNPNITFTLANDLTNGPTINITLPYAAFDLQANSPLINTTTKYFPLLRAVNETQITLGRAFLQEAMLVADYDRGNFSLWPCVWNEAAQQNIVTLQSAISHNSSSAAASSSSVPAPGQSMNAKIGLAVGLALGLPILLALVFLFWARHTHRWPFHHRPPTSQPPPIFPLNAELDSKVAPAEVDTERRKSTLKPLVNVHEADADRGQWSRPELAGTAYAMMLSKSELEGQYRAELSSTVSPNSTRSAADQLELPASPLPSRAHTNTSTSISLIEGRRELPASESARGREPSGSRMLMELPGAPVPDVYLKSRSPARTPPRSPRSPRSPREIDMRKQALPPLPGAARTPDRSFSMGSAGETLCSEGSRTPRSLSQFPAQHTAGYTPSQGSTSPRDEQPAAKASGRSSRRVVDGGYF